MITGNFNYLILHMKFYMFSDQKVFDISDKWKRRKISPLRFKDTHESLFLPSTTTPKLERMKHLVQENSKGRHYNVLGTQHAQVYYNAFLYYFLVQDNSKGRHYNVLGTQHAQV